MSLVKRLGIAVGMMGSFVSAAHASDISGPIARFDWSGVYVGAHGGYAWGEADVAYEGEAGGGDLDGGFWGGALAGYNLQNDAFVFGIEGDFGLGDVEGWGLPTRVPGSEEYRYAYSMDWNGHLRARAGFAEDRALFFVAGGFAVASHTLGVEETFIDQWQNEVTQWNGEDNHTHYGWSVGGGVEYALTDSVLLRVEYLYDDYGSKNYTDDEDYEYDVVLTAQTVRAAVSFKF